MRRSRYAPARSSCRSLSALRSTGPRPKPTRATGGAIADALESGEIKGKLGEVVLVHAKDRPFHRVLAVGLGERANFELALLARYAGVAVRYLGRRTSRSSR